VIAGSPFFVFGAERARMADRTRVHVFVSGRVQGVFYRATTRDTARDRGVDGWVKNLADGRVEAVFEGPREDVESMVEWCHTGSPQARVEDVDVEYEAPEGVDGFEVRY
jgi:acylphosphatase